MVKYSSLQVSKTWENFPIGLNETIAFKAALPHFTSLERWEEARGWKTGARFEMSQNLF